MQRLTLVLLGMWLLVTMVGPWFARDLEQVQFAGFPLSFWVASQGALLIYVALIAAYAWAMERLDAQCLREQDDASTDVDHDR